MTMKILALILLAGIFVSCSGGHDEHPAGSPKADSVAAKEYYTCPMHPSVVSDRPGACPVCGMALVKKTKPQETSSGEMETLRRVSLSAAQRAIANVSTVEAGRSDLRKEISAVGVVDFAEPLQASVTARFNGRIEKLYVSFTGARVQKGEPLFELHSPDLIAAQQELLLAVSAAADTEVTSLSPQNLLEATRERLHVHFGMTHEQIAELEQRQGVHETMTFRSPISGTVITKDIQEGEYVTEGRRLYQLADLSRVWVYLDAYERDVPFIKLGHAVKVTAESYPGKVYTGKVTFIDPVIDPETRTVRVRSEFDNRSGELKPSMFVRAQIGIPSRNALTIPATAVMYTGKQTVVWVEVAENTFEPRAVSLGSSGGPSVEVLSGLRPGDRVVVSGGFLIESESQLQQPASGGHNHGGGAGGGGEGEPPADRVQIRVDGSYAPNLVHARRGVPLTLAFDRRDDSRCTDEVVLKDFQVRKKLPAHTVTEIRIVPEAEGEYAFVCGMGMIEGKILVHAAK